MISGDVRKKGIKLLRSSVLGILFVFIIWCGLYKMVCGTFLIIGVDLGPSACGAVPSWCMWCITAFGVMFGIVADYLNPWRRESIPSNDNPATD
jgi:hypothetical protein